MDKILHHQGWWLSHYLQVFCTSQVVVSDFFHQQLLPVFRCCPKSYFFGRPSTRRSSRALRWKRPRPLSRRLGAVGEIIIPTKNGYCKHYLKPHGKETWSTSSWWFQHIFLTICLFDPWGDVWETILKGKESSEPTINLRGYSQVFRGVILHLVGGFNPFEYV